MKLYLSDSWSLSLQHFAGRERLCHARLLFFTYQRAARAHLAPLNQTQAWRLPLMSVALLRTARTLSICFDHCCTCHHCYVLPFPDSSAVWTSTTVLFNQPENQASRDQFLITDAGDVNHLAVVIVTDSLFYRKRHAPASALWMRCLIRLFTPWEMSISRTISKTLKDVMAAQAFQEWAVDALCSQVVCCFTLIVFRHFDQPWQSNRLFEHYVTLSKFLFFTA